MIQFKLFLPVLRIRYFGSMTGKKEEVMQLALEFYLPMFLLYSMYDVADSKKKKQEICDKLKQHINRFAENFQKLI